MLPGTLDQLSLRSSVNSDPSDGLDPSGTKGSEDLTEHCSEDTACSREAPNVPELATPTAVDGQDQSSKKPANSISDIEIGKANDTAKALRSPARRLPPTPPRPPRVFRPPPQRPSSAKPSVASGAWSSSSTYCFDPFIEYADARPSGEMPVSCVRADSLDIDPFMFQMSIKSAPSGGSMPERPLLEPTIIAGAEQEETNHPVARPEAVPLPAEAVRHPSTQSSPKPQPSSIDMAAPAAATRRSSRSSGRLHLSVSIKRWIKRSPGRTKTVSPPPSSQNLPEMTPSPFDNQDWTQVTARERSDSTSSNEAEVQLKLPEYHRGLRKQSCPPRVRYAGQQGGKPEAVRQISPLAYGFTPSSEISRPGFDI